MNDQLEKLRKFSIIISIDSSMIDDDIIEKMFSCKLMDVCYIYEINIDNVKSFDKVMLCTRQYS
jgi:hypothetical protein